MLFDVGVQKIDNTMLDTYRMVVAVFSVIDVTNWIRFFKDIFLVANVSPEVTLGMPFLTLSGADVDFLDWELRWKTYTTREALLTTRHVKLVEKNEFAATVIDLEHETFVVHVASLSSVTSLSSTLFDVDVHPFHKWLDSQRSFYKGPVEYANIADMFFPDLASKTP